MATVTFIGDTKFFATDHVALKIDVLELEFACIFSRLGQLGMFKKSSDLIVLFIGTFFKVM